MNSHSLVRDSLGMERYLIGSKHDHTDPRVNHICVLGASTMGKVRARNAPLDFPSQSVTLATIRYTYI